jgi:glucose-specific phosphotransferase system IIA component
VTERPALVLKALGTASNIESLSACITRLRVIVKNPSQMDVPQLKRLGAVGVFCSGQNVQAVFGVESDQLKDQIHHLMLNSKQILLQPLLGKIVDLAQVPDETFSSEVLGKGFAIDPIEGLVRAPADAIVATITPTHHALGLRLHSGIEILIHVGLDTVKMKGQGFEILVKEGQHVTANTPLLKFDLEAVRKNAKSTLTPVIITESNGEKFEWKFNSI